MIKGSKKFFERWNKYKAATSKYHHNTGRVFWGYQYNKHHGQHLGKSWFGKYPSPRDIAKYLGVYLLSYNNTILYILSYNNIIL